MGKQNTTSTTKHGDSFKRDFNPFLSNKTMMSPGGFFGAAAGPGHNGPTAGQRDDLPTVARRNPAPPKGWLKPYKNGMKHLSTGNLT